MKRVLFLSGFLFFAFPVFGQDADSLAVVREVDTLLVKANRHAAVQDYRAAAEAILEAHAAMHAAKVLDTLKLANIILQNANYFYGARMLHEGDSILREAVALRKARFGENHGAYAFALYVRG